MKYMQWIRLLNACDFLRYCYGGTLVKEAEPAPGKHKLKNLEMQH